MCAPKTNGEHLAISLRKLLIPDLKASREIIKIALPVVAGMGSYTILLNADTAFLGRISPTAQGVAGIADIAFLVIALTLGGISIGTQVLVARRFGEGRTERIGVITDNGMVAALAVGVVSTAFLLFFLPQLTALCFESPQLRALGEPFLQVKLYGLVIFLLMAPLRGFIVGIGETIHFLVASAIRAACNVFFDYALIFGKFGMPEMGIQGAPWAQNIALAVALGYLVAVVFFGSYKKRFSLFSFRLEWAVLRKMFYLSTPGGVRHFIGLGAYLVFFRIVEQMGTVDLAVANIGRAVFNFQFMPVLGIGFAVSSLVSRNLGQKRPLQAEANTWHAYQLATLVSVAVYVIVAVFAPEIASVFTEDPHVAHLAVGCFRIGGLFLVLMPAGMIFAATLEGAGNIWLVLGFEAVCCAIYLGCAWLFGITWGEGVTGAYAAETVYWLVFGTVCAAFFLRRAWHHTKV